MNTIIDSAVSNICLHDFSGLEFIEAAGLYTIIVFYKNCVYYPTGKMVGQLKNTSQDISYFYQQYCKKIGESLALKESGEYYLSLLPDFIH